MSVPPHQPGPFDPPDPYGQQPVDFDFGQHADGYSQQLVYGQQPDDGASPGQLVYPLSGVDAQPPSFPPSDQPPPGHGLPPGGYPGQGGPHINPATLRWILGGGALFVVALVVLLFYAFGAFDDSSNSPDAVAAVAAAAITHKDNARTSTISCDGGTTATNNPELDQFKGDPIKARVVGKADVFHNNASAILHLTIYHSGQIIDVDAVLRLMKPNGKWCVQVDGLIPDDTSAKISGPAPAHSSPRGSGQTSDTPTPTPSSTPTPSPSPSPSAGGVGETGTPTDGGGNSDPPTPTSLATPAPTS